jgi:hypothetical protein
MPNPKDDSRLDRFLELRLQIRIRKVPVLRGKGGASAEKSCSSLMITAMCINELR